MAEIYKLSNKGARLLFEPGGLDLPPITLERTFKPGAEAGDAYPVCRMGDPDLAHCVVFKRKNAPGGIFSLHDRDGLLFAAYAENNLVFALAMGFFGELTANARYGADVYETMEEPDD